MLADIETTITIMWRCISRVNSYCDNNGEV